MINGTNLLAAADLPREQVTWKVSTLLRADFFAFVWSNKTTRLQFCETDLFWCLNLWGKVLDYQIVTSNEYKDMKNSCLLSVNCYQDQFP
jgi:hypothetical protein